MSESLVFLFFGSQVQFGFRLVWLIIFAYSHSLTRASRRPPGLNLSARVPGVGSFVEYIRSSPVQRSNFA